MTAARRLAALAILLAAAPAAPAAVVFERASSGVAEGTAQRLVFVRLSAARSQTVTVPFTVSGSAGAGDFTLGDASPLVFPPGELRRSIAINPVADAADELDETVILTLGTPQGDTLGTPAAHQVTITNDDAPPPGAPQLSFALDASSEPESTATRLVRVTLSAPAAEPVRVAFALEPAGARAGEDFVLQTASPLTIPAGESGRNIVVAVLDDGDDELAEGVTLVIRDVAQATAAAPERHALTLVDDDPLPAAAPTVEFRVALATVAEDGGPRSLALRLSKPATQRVAVPFTVSAGSAAGDFALAGASPVVFEPGQRTRSLLLTPTDDAAAEADESLTVRLGTPAGARLGRLGTMVATIADDDRAPAGFNAGSPLGTNLAAVTDFTHEYPFANFFKQARPWISGNSETFQFDDGRVLPLDPDGNVRSLAPDQVARAILFTGTPRDTALNGKRLILRYDGRGTLQYAGASVLSSTPGRDVIRLGTGGSEDEATLIVNLFSTVASNPVRNLRLTPAGGICRGNPFATVAAAADCPGGDFVSFEDAATAGEIVFNPEFLDGLKTYRGIRFMDWLRTNNSAQVNPGERPLLSNAFWSTDAGVPLEAAVALANVLDADPWINLPHQASDAWAATAATILREQLEPGRVAYVEYSNETWNGIFTQAEFVQDRGQALGLDQPEDNRFIAGLRFYSQRAQQLFDQFDLVFGAARAERLLRVCATQAVNPFLTQTILEFGEAADKCDRFAIAPYFGDTVVETERGEAFKAAGVDGVFSWLQTGTPDLGFGSLAELDAAIAAQKETVDAFGIPLITYEGGQHFLAAGPVQFDEALNALMDAVNRDPRMKTAYLDYLDSWRTSGGDEVFWHYLHTDRWSVFGRWGSRESTTQPRAQAPKFDALQTYIENRPLP